MKFPVVTLHRAFCAVARSPVGAGSFLTLLLAVLWAAGFGLSLAVSATRDSAGPGSTTGSGATGAGVVTASAPLASTSGPASAANTRAPSQWLGASGSLRAVMGTPAKLASDPVLKAFASAIQTPGVHQLSLLTPGGAPVYAMALLPYRARQGARLQSYRLGSWPEDAWTRANPKYAPPTGFIEVTPENQDTPVSESFRLRDFLTHDQGDVWPKFLVVQPTLLDKLELISQELERRGLPDRLHVMSGFRTPQYNAQGVGPKGGRASRSRHMYGDAADIFVDADGNGSMDDINGDGRVNVADARILFQVAQSVESRHPELVGGLSPYPANRAHGPFVHVDVRGKRARW